MRLLPKHLLLSVLPTLATLAVVLFVMRDLVIELLAARIEETVNDRAEQAAELVHAKLEHELLRLRVLARRLPDDDPAAIRAALWSERAAAEELLALHWIDAAGELIGTDGIDPEVVRAAAARGRTVEMIERGGMRLLILFVRGERASMVGTISADEMIRPLLRLSVGQRGFAVLEDRDGRLLSPPPAEEWRREDAVWTAIDPLGWRLGLVLPPEELIADVRTLRLPSVTIVGVAIIALLLSGMLVSRTLTRPLRALQRLSERLGSGELSARADVRSNDELGDLARSFNQMAARLHRVVDESKSLVESLPQPIFVHADGRFLYLNPAARRLAAEPDAVGRMIDFFAADSAKSELHRLMEGGRPARIGLKTGGTLDLEAVALDVTFDGAQARLVIIDDVTEKRRFDDQVRHTQKLESLGLVAGGIAHDFNNMLTAIMGNNELVLMDTPAGSPQFGPLEQVRRATMKAADLTRQMLAYAGRGQFQLAQIDLNRIVSEIGELLHASITKKATLTMDLARGTLAIEADGAQIQQVVMNLITNASEALEERPGEILVRTATVELDGTHPRTLEGLPKGTYAMLEVTDTGIGMDAKTRERIFDPFFTTKLTGRGLGLAGVLGIVRAHLGDIAVDSEPGRGTRFQVYFPRGHAPVLEKEAQAIDETHYYGNGVVLVADDEEPVLQLTRRILSRYGFEVACASNGEQAVDLFEAHRGRIVCALLDLTMPLLSGREVLERIRALDPKMPVVLMSGYEDGSDDLIAEGDAIPFIAKPFGVSALIGAIRDATMAYGA